MSNDPFAPILGYESLKKEARTIISWFADPNRRNDPSSTLPKGILFYGEPGNGKTLFMSCMKEALEAPYFELTTGESKSEITPASIHEVFAKAKEYPFAVVIIDELQLLLCDSKENELALRKEFDELSSGSVLVLAATNSLRRISSPLQRNGRFGIRIEIEAPYLEDRIKLFTTLFDRLGVDVSSVDFEFIGHRCEKSSCADIVAICNDVAFRHKGKPIADEEIEESYERVVQGELSILKNVSKNWETAVHEAGHAVMMKNSKDLVLCKIRFTDHGGETAYFERSEREWSNQKAIDKIQISMAGYLAEEIVNGSRSGGSTADLKIVYDLANYLAKKEGACGIGFHNDDDIYDDALTGPKQKDKNDKAVIRLLTKLERKTRRYLKSHKKEIVTLAKAMMENGAVCFRQNKPRPVKA